MRILNMLRNSFEEFKGDQKFILVNFETENITKEETLINLKHFKTQKNLISF